MSAFFPKAKTMQKGYKNKTKVPGSFRDPSGFLFFYENKIFRQINSSYRENYDHLKQSGLYQRLVDSDLLIPHEETDVEAAQPDIAYKIIQPEQVSFISYPYEWSFSQLKDAALATLAIQKVSLDFGMSLKDCSTYNIQFVKGKPKLIDTLSFELHREGQPWVAYRQFCQHFLAPLALMRYCDVRLNQLFRIYIDGVPLDLASSLLPLHTRFVFSLLSHIHLHAKSQKHFADKSVNRRNHRISRTSFLGIIDSLRTAVNRLKWRLASTEWSDYYDDTNYSFEAFKEKKRLVSEFLSKINPKGVWDFGANTGIFSRIASDRGIRTISFDVDPAAVEKNYLESVQKKESNILPLLLDLTNPSASLGWQNQERMSLLGRGPVDAALALALIHHLAISNNLPLEKIAEFFNKICSSLIIEFVPKTDSQVQRLLSTREDIFPDYTQPAFERTFLQYFEVLNCEKIMPSERTLYLMRRRKV